MTQTRLDFPVLSPVLSHPYLHSLPALCRPCIRLVGLPGPAGREPYYKAIKGGNMKSREKVVRRVMQLFFEISSFGEWDRTPEPVWKLFFSIEKIGRVKGQLNDRGKYGGHLAGWTLCCLSTLYDDLHCLLDHCLLYDALHLTVHDHVVICQALVHDIKTSIVCSRKNDV